MEGIYKVNLIPSDLSTEETILQIADTLDNLNGIVDDVFSRIMNRIQQNMTKTSKLKERIEASKTKVEKITGMQKAIKIFSSAKYPASIKHEHYESVFGLDGYQHVPKKVVLSGKTQGQQSDIGIQEKLHFYHVKVAPPKIPKPKEDFNLKSVINEISTVGELLVFNTDESPYLGTVSKVPAYVPRAPNVEHKSLLEAAPSSITNRDVMKREADEYMYAPGMGMVPELEMPLDLPHLPGIAGDVQFSMANDGSIAPSVVTSPVAATVSLPEAELPDLKELPHLPDVDLKSAEMEPTLPDIPDAPPMPMMTSVVPDPLTLIPPPPPPPPPPPMAPIPPVDAARPAKPPPAASSGGDVHSNLMAAIRQAGGAGRAGLRPAADATPDKPNAVPGGDLMADLHAKLSMRRRGISGAERRAGGGSVLHTLASVIPEPDVVSDRRSSSDDDWD